MKAAAFVLNPYVVLKMMLFYYRAATASVFLFSFLIEGNLKVAAAEYHFNSLWLIRFKNHPPCGRNESSSLL
jgi:hypothetical protein